MSLFCGCRSSELRIEGGCGLRRPTGRGHGRPAWGMDTIVRPSFPIGITLARGAAAEASHVESGLSPAFISSELRARTEH
jgi:hypothetical protein